MKHFYQRLLISALLLICAISTNAEEIDGIAYTLNGNTKTASVKKRDGNYSGDIVIPETITYHDVTYSVTSIDYGAFSDCTGMTSIAVPKSVTSIGENAFYGCIGLTSVTIPNSVTSIRDNAFYGCIGLTSVTIPNSVTSIGGQAFISCTGLTSITIPNSVTSIGYLAFAGCTGLTSITIPNSVTSIEKGAFYNCIGLTSITIGNSVISIGEYAFRGCTGLTSISIPNSVTSIGSVPFHGCTGLTSIYCNISNPNNINESAFNYLSLTVYIPVGTKEAYENRGFQGFHGTFVEMDMTGVEEVDGITYILDYISKTASVTSKEGSNYSGDIVIPKTITYHDVTYSVTSIDYGAFWGCSDLTSITIPNSVTSIGAYALAECSGLTSITIPNSVTSIGTCAFVYCLRLTSVTIPNSVTSIGEGAFLYCERLTSVYCNISDPACINESSFSYISSTIYIPIGTKEAYESRVFQNFRGTFVEMDMTGVEYILDYISKTASVTIKKGAYYPGDIVIPETITFEDVTYTVTSIGEYAFADCHKLTSITIPNSVTSIGEGAFWGCIGLTSIVVEKDNPAYDSREDCNAIIETQTNTLVIGCKNTIIPNSVISVGEYAFYHCPGLTSITIPNSVTSIGEYAFSWCSELASFYCNISNPSCINKFAFYRISSTIYVPIGTKEAYESRGFQEFRGTFVEMDMTGIEETKMMQVAKPTEYYNLKGQRINRPDRGVVIVKYSDGTSRKVMMK